MDRRLPAGREDVPWATVAAILTIARFCEPGSELHIEHTWYRRTALDELIDVPLTGPHRSPLRRLDRLLPHKEAIEKHLKQRLGDLFDLDYDLLLYDVTSTYFEGEGRPIRMAQRGYSRDSRPDRPQVCIGLVVTRTACRWVTRSSPAIATIRPRSADRRGDGGEVRPGQRGSG